ncbi:nucleotidyltransferase family protein [Thermosediminibacter oceani]|uniref:Molybdopterin-guanine dinucleotide biosynthesis protein A-like protein n=1 Tax=Thermosediminibacter oceani (strain ATCC BAA-1034 / DSM 16646 / JW/IW-1228P) TaxID=555079 RepID=D9RZE4_THEOJ|nr:nucleotidyltransferase family protein [Thermosediminibacter oceani]ADL06842.1 molybdopterin-guanine dinucleotide biosynthesis protein A-like protein [Thermosediminibacter oceani DSM 16646]
MLKALVLAGGDGDEKLQESEGTKALVRINGREMILYILDALKKLDYIEKIAIVGPKEKLSSIKVGPNVVVVEESDSIVGNILRGLELFSDDDEILIMTCDIPMVTAEAIDDFVKKAKGLNADFCYPIIRKEDTEKKYPGIKRTYARVREGTFTGGNVALVKVGSAKRCIKKAEEFFTYRKNPLKLASILGFSVVLKFLLGKLSIPELEKRVYDIFGIKARAVISDFPEIGNDVDKKSDLELVREVLGREVVQ